MKPKHSLLPSFWRWLFIIVIFIAVFTRHSGFSWGREIFQAVVFGGILVFYFQGSQENVQPACRRLRLWVAGWGVTWVILTVWSWMAQRSEALTWLRLTAYLSAVAGSVVSVMAQEHEKRRQVRSHQISSGQPE